MNVDEGIRELCTRGFLFHAIRDEDGEVTVLGRHGAEDVVWTYQDGALSTIQALLDQPHPDAPGSPRLARRAPDELWLPPSFTRV